MVVGDASIDIETLVIGAGPGGYVAAIRAAQMGQHVIIADKSALGGVCLNRGCIPSKALISAAEFYEGLSEASDFGIEVGQAHVDFTKVQTFKNSVIERLTGGVASLLKANKIEVFAGEAMFINEHEARLFNEQESPRYRFKNCIIATGSRPVEIPSFPFGGRILSSTEALELAEIPKSLAIIGGGYIGVELGQMFAKFGTEVTIIEGSDRILPGFDEEMTRYVSRNLKKANVQVYTNGLAQGVEQKEDAVTVTFLQNDEERHVTTEYVLVTVGRRPNTDGDLGLDLIGIKMDERGYIEVDDQCRTNHPHIYAIGDIVHGPALAHKASYEGKVAAEVIAGKASRVDYKVIPAVVFSDPECASVGFSEKEAQAVGYKVMVGRFPYAANGRALSLQLKEGFVKLIGDEETGLLIGAQVMGREASNLIAELGLAIEMGTTFEDLALTIHAHPTLGEMIGEAAETGLGIGIHLKK